jgi:hypothetical protein
MKNVSIRNDIIEASSPPKRVFSVAQTFLSAVSHGFPACMGSALATTKLTLVKSADRNVGDTADRNVCATKAPAQTHTLQEERVRQRGAFRSYL